MLNLTLRPVTSKWHRAMEEGHLDSRDGSDAFRGDLAEVRKELEVFADKLHVMAYGTPLADKQTPPALSEADVTVAIKPIVFGIVPSSLIPDKIARAINKNEGDEIAKRRKHYGIADCHGPGRDRPRTFRRRHPIGDLLSGRDPGAGEQGVPEGRGFPVDRLGRRLHRLLPVEPAGQQGGP